MRIEIDGEPLERAERTAESKDTDETARTRQVLAEKARVENELLFAHRQRAAQELETISAKSERATTAMRDALERGDWDGMTERQREISALEVQRGQVEARAAHLDRVSPVIADPVEAFATAPGRSQAAADWIRSHPEYVLDERKNAKLSAAHNDAIAEGMKPDTPDYFAHINKFVGLDNSGPARRSNGSAGGGQLRVRVGSPKPGEQLGPNEIRMSHGEYKAATETLTWNYDSPDGKHKKGEPLGVEEYLRRKGVMHKQGGWFDKLESY